VIKVEFIKGRTASFDKVKSREITGTDAFKDVQNVVQRNFFSSVSHMQAY